MTPEEFRREYVEPAIQCWLAHGTVAHLAVNAIAQLDALADVVWIALGQPGGQTARTYRNELGKREPAIAIVRDACDSHKHGRLGRATAVHVSGERPVRTIRVGYFSGEAIEVLVIRMLDGFDEEVGSIILGARDAWVREFDRLGYDPNWSPLDPL